MSYSDWAAITEYHRLGVLNNGRVFSHRSGGWQSGCQPGWLLEQAFFLAFKRLPVTVCLHGAGRGRGGGVRMERRK